jgi:hypothetical protein
LSGGLISQLKVLLKVSGDAIEHPRGVN